MLFAMLDLPPPVSKNVYTRHLTEVRHAAIRHAEHSLCRAREEVQDHYGVSSLDEIVDILVSADGTWQKRGFPLFGAVFVIAHETGQVIDYCIKFK